MNTQSHLMAYVPSWYDGDVNAGLLRYVLETGGLLEDGGARIRQIPDRFDFDGVVSHSWPNSQEAEFVESCNCPVIETANQEFPGGTHRVAHDWQAAGRIAAEHLLRLGIRQLPVCYLNDNHRDHALSLGISTVARRAQAQTWRLAPQLRRYPKTQFENVLAEELSTSSGQIGIIACHAFLALAVIDACKRIGRRIPQDVAIITFASDAASIPASLVPLSEVVMDNYGLGHLAGSSLGRLIKGEHIPQHQLVLPRQTEIRQSSSTSAVRDPIVREIARTIEERHSLPIGADELAQVQSEQSRRTAERRFRSVTGESIGEALKRTRVKTAQSLLRNTPTLPLAAVARRSGFSTAQYMCRVFRKETGRSPASHRLRHDVD